MLVIITIDMNIKIHVNKYQLIDIKTLYKIVVNQKGGK